MKILAIDPGNIHSGYVFVDSDTLEIIEFGKVENEVLLDKMFKLKYEHLAIEMIASYGMAVGKSVFDTCVWIGRFLQVANQRNIKHDFIYRKDEKIAICGSMKAKDSNIRQALIDKYAKHDFKNGKGTKANQDYFYGFKSDIWASFAVFETWLLIKKKEM